MDDNKKPLILSSGEKMVMEDLVKNKELLNAKYFAYPYGRYDENTIKYLKETGS